MTRIPPDARRETGGPCERPELAAALPRWDRLSTAERAKLEGHAAACPRCGPALRLLREAEDWLVSQAPVRPTSACPDAEDLFDYGRGPGARPMLQPRREAIEEHLGECVECEALVATLASKPPSPLILDTDEPLAEAEPRRRSRRMPRLRALAAAAAAVTAVFFVWSETRAAAPTGLTEIAYPGVATLRGEEAGRLLYPRGNVLPRTTDAQARFGSGLVFELSHEVRGDSYRIEVLRHDGGAFSKGTPVFELSAGTPLLRPTPEQLASLTPGDYTWEAWAEIDGLGLQLGRRDFHVVDDAELARALDATDDLPRIERATRRLALLWDAGYHSDARALARTLPASPARDGFLERVPDL